MMLRNKFTHINFFRSIFGNRISPGQIDQIDRITFMVASSLLGIHRHSAIIPHSFAQSGSPVKERSLPTIRIPNQSDIDRPGFLGNFPGNLVFCKRTVISFLIYRGSTDDFNQTSLTPSQRNMAIHQFIFDRIV